MDKILVIDDDISTGEILKIGLETDGRYQVFLENRGSHGHAAARKHRPDLILLDIIMPDRNGFDVLKELKSDNNTRGIPVIMLTALDTDDAMLKSTKLYNDGYIVKPIAINTLKERIDSVLKLFKKEPQEEPQDTDAAKETKTRSVKILVVDDSKSICDLLDSFLTPRGYKVVTCSEPKNAPALLKSENPDIVMLDLVMSGLDGIEILKGIKERSPKTRVIMVTGIVDQAVIDEAMALKADDVIIKPFSMDQLCATLSKHISLMRNEGAI